MFTPSFYSSIFIASRTDLITLLIDINLFFVCVFYLQELRRLKSCGDLLCFASRGM